MATGFDTSDFLPEINPADNPRNIGGLDANGKIVRGRLSDAETLAMLKSQLRDPNRNPDADPAVDAELQREIARLQKKMDTSDFQPDAGFVPDRASQSDVRKADMAMAQPKPTAAPDPLAGVGENPAEFAAGLGPTRLALGAASPALGLIQLNSNLQDRIYKAIGIPFRPGEMVNDYLARLEEMKQQGRLEQGSKGFDYWETLGNILSPAFIKAAGIVKPAAGLLGRMGQSGVMGAAAGATAPVTDAADDPSKYWTEKSNQTTVGALAGLGIPAVTTLLSKLGTLVWRGLLEPHLSPDSIIGRTLLKAAGDKADQVRALLQRNAKEKELVPGSEPTAGQAATEAGSTGFSALQRQAEITPGVADQYVARRDAQNAARLAAVRSVGQTPEALVEAEAARSESTGPMYKEAYDTMVKRDPALRKLWNNPYFRDQLGTAWKLFRSDQASAAAAGEPQPTIRNNLTQFLQYVKEGMDSDLRKTGNDALSNVQRQAVQNAKKQLTAWMSEKNPAWDEARTAFAEQSAPINQMKIGQYLEQQLVPALSDEAKQSATKYANALENAPKTIQKAAGGPRFQKLATALTPDQLQAVESVQADLARDARFNDLAAAGAKATPDVKDLATANFHATIGGPMPSFLLRALMVAHTIVDRSLGSVDDKLAAKLAVEMLNPEAVGNRLADAQREAARNARWSDLVYRGMTGVATPGALNTYNREMNKGK